MLWTIRDAALSFIDELEESCRGLANDPERFQLVPRYQASGIRRRVHGRYLIFYRMHPDRVTVLRILHGARDYEPLLDPDADE
ncbi:MAG: type II toxin-antitoxin system RelE/ParE family toxin [Caulobacteraceae bacterium]